MNKYLCKFYVSVTRKENSFIIWKLFVVGLSGSRPPSKVTASQQNIFICDIPVYLFSEANKWPNSYLKQLIAEGNL